jgi:acylphosphatase
MVARRLAGIAGDRNGRDRVSARLIRHVIISGRVQGVGYRAWTEHVARDRGIEGWVRNRRDGSVEALFAGPEAAVLAMIANCRNGPPGSRVEGIDEREGSAEELALHGRARFAILETP